MNRRLLLLCVCAICLSRTAGADVFNMPEGTKSLEMVPVGNPGNPADDTGYGSVDYAYRIGKYEVTTAQYVQFLNAKGKSDPHGLYSIRMTRRGRGPGGMAGCMIERSGTDGNYTYSVPSEYANRPVNWVSFWSACRFANWLHNGQGDGDTETGAYTLTGAKDRTIRRNPDARYFVPSEDEWYKGAYYDPAKQGVGGYWQYPTRSDMKPSRDFSSPNAANYYDDGYVDTEHSSRRWVRSPTRRAPTAHSTRVGTCRSGSRRSIRRCSGVSAEGRMGTTAGTR